MERKGSGGGRGRKKGGRKKENTKADPPQSGKRAHSLSGGAQWSWYLERKREEKGRGKIRETEEGKGRRRGRETCEELLPLG